MAIQVVLIVEDEEEAWTFVRDIADHSGRPLLTPIQENAVHVSVVSVERVD